MSWVTALGAVGTSLCWWAERLMGHGLTVFGRDPSAPTEVPWGAVLLATAVGGVAAVVLVRIANRTKRPVRTFAPAVTVGFALTCIPPVQAAATTGTLVGLLVMHLIAAAVIVPPAARLLRTSEPAGPSQRQLRPNSSGNLR